MGAAKIATLAIEPLKYVVAPRHPMLKFEVMVAGAMMALMSVAAPLINSVRDCEALPKTNVNKVAETTGKVLV